MKLKFIINIIRIKNKNKVVVGINSMLREIYIQERDTLINDKIYTDPNELLVMKSKHNQAVRDSFKELLFDMSKCDVAVATAVKPLLERLKAQEISNNNLKIQIKNQIEESQAQIDELKTQLMLLSKKLND
ncbi:hypothetical protein [Spiroplasma endosymbiont of Othius punctulatus]|uniref:hypothetical protein n=1 Tax=Spiroplasma endosymbiont of Othius punctulatus TaxID=3066289 RepID=UPI0030D288DF